MICDRYVHSSVAYQGARGVDQAAILSAQRHFAPEPDAIFLMEVPVDTALARIGSDRCGRFSTFEVREDLEAVAAVYRNLTDPLIRRIDGTGSLEHIQSIIMDCLKDTRMRIERLRACSHPKLTLGSLHKALKYLIL